MFNNLYRGKAKREGCRGELRCPNNTLDKLHIYIILMSTWKRPMKTLPLLFGTLIGFAMASRAQTLTNGLVAYYPFNGNANDAMESGNNGIVYNTTLTADRFGNPNSRAMALPA